VAIGGVIYMHVPLADSSLSCEVPQFARRMGDGSYTVATITELRLQYKLLITAPLKEVLAAAALRRDPWLFYGRNPSALQADYYQLKPHALTLSPPASSGAPLLQLRFYLKLGIRLLLHPTKRSAGGGNQGSNREPSDNRQTSYLIGGRDHRLNLEMSELY
jgi:hypothetical protein